MTNPYNLEESFFTTKDKSLSSTAILISNENAKILDKLAPQINTFFQQQQLTNNLKISGTVTCDNIIAKNLQTVDQETGNITSNITVNSVQNTMNIFEANSAFIDFIRSNNITVTSTISSSTLNANVINVTTSITSNEITSNNVNVTGVLGVGGIINGSLNGNVNGNLTGNVNGNVEGNLTGNVNGNVIGNLTGNATTASAAEPGSTLENDINKKLDINATFFGGRAATADNATFATSAGSASFATTAGNATNAINATNASAAASGSTLEQQINDLIQRVEDLENGS